MTAKKPSLVPPLSSDDAPISIAKPDTDFSLNKFKSKRAAAVANVETLQTGLPHHSIAQAKDSSAYTPTKKFIGRTSCVLSTCRSRGKNAIPCT